MRRLQRRSREKLQKRVAIPLNTEIGQEGVILFSKQANLSPQELTALINFLSK